MNCRLFRQAAALTAVLTLPLLTVADEEAADSEAAATAEALTGEALNCVSLGRIRQTDIVDDQTILFYMRGPEIYVNRLPRRCPGLRIAGSFSYKTSLTELCNTDVITVIRSLGVGPSLGPTCGLGMFQPITAEAVAALKEPPAEPEPESVAPEIQPPETN